MNLKEKLKQKGYQPFDDKEIVWVKRYNEQFTLRIIIVENKLYEALVEQNWFIRQQNEIDNLQIAFNNLKRDIKEICSGNDI